jgi:hypothetical protein
MIVAWLWLDQEVSATQARGGSDIAFYRGNLAACRYFYRWELPRIDRWLRLLDPVDSTTLDAEDEWFG